MPELPLTAEAPAAPGRDTVESIRLGVDRGAVGAVRELIRVFQSRFAATPLRLVAIGGDAPFFCREIPELTAGPPDFTLRGLLRAWVCHENP